MLIAAPTRKVVVVNGTVELLGLFETMLGAGCYDVVIVESTEHAFSHIKRVHPHLVVLCLQMDHAEGFQVLSMLQMDAETKAIPVLTCTCDDDGLDLEYDSPEFGDAQRRGSAAAAWMN
jgi:DNA-binding response OmpR family regulator